MLWLTKEWEKVPDERFGQFLINKGIIADNSMTWNMDFDNYDLPFEVEREVTFWTALDSEPSAVKDLSTSHIKAILKTQKHIKNTYIEELLKKELKYRKNNKLTNANDINNEFFMEINRTSPEVGFKQQCKCDVFPCKHYYQDIHGTWIYIK